MSHFNNCRGTDFILGAIVGSSIATLTTLLFTTKQGKRIQNKIKETFQDLEDDAKEAWSETKDKAEEMGERVRKKTTQSNGSNGEKE